MAGYPRISRKRLIARERRNIRSAYSAVLHLQKGLAAFAHGHFLFYKLYLSGLCDLNRFHLFSLVYIVFVPYHSCFQRRALAVYLVFVSTDRI